MSDTSLAVMILDRARRYGSKRVFQRKRGNRWEDIVWQQFGEQIVHAAQGLAVLGFQPGERLAILADNRPQWPLIDLACLYLGGVDVPLYLTSHPHDLAFILKDAGVTFLAVAGDDQRQKIKQIAAQVPTLSQIINLDHGPDDELDDASAPQEGRFGHLPSLSLKGLLARGAQAAGATQPVSHPDLATIIYTSGTTGLPKGVMLTHANLLANAEDATQILPITEEDQTISFLPLSHSFERTAGLYTILRTGACIAYGAAQSLSPKT